MRCKKNKLRRTRYYTRRNYWNL